MSVKVMDQFNWNDVVGIIDKSQISASLDEEGDTMLILPDSGYRIKVRYGSKRSITDVNICSPFI
jgi:hypothetical protein